MSGQRTNTAWRVRKSVLGVTLFCVAMLGTMSPISAAPPPPLTQEEKAISGVWKLLRAEFVNLDGSTSLVPRLGDRPAGKIIYHASHHFCFFLTRAQDDPSPMPENGLSSYCGTWSIDPKTQTMSHQTEMANRPSEHSLLRKPHYEFRDGHYYLFPPFNPKEVKAYVLVFEKVSD